MDLHNLRIPGRLLSNRTVLHQFWLATPFKDLSIVERSVRRSVVSALAVSCRKNSKTGSLLPQARNARPELRHLDPNLSFWRFVCNSKWLRRTAPLNHTSPTSTSLSMTTSIRVYFAVRDRLLIVASCVVFFVPSAGALPVDAVPISTLTVSDRSVIRDLSRILHMFESKSILFCNVKSKTLILTREKRPFVLFIVHRPWRMAVILVLQYLEPEINC
jgi:hypothetical protein